MRPCDGTSGLVRGSRRKAVFAFNGPFSEEACLIYAFGHLLLPCNFESVGKNRKPPSTTRFLATKPQVAEAQTRGLVGGSRFFPALLETLYGSMRQIPETLSTLPFSSKETAGRSVAAFRCGRQVQNLPHTSELTQIGGVNVPARDRAGKCHFQNYISYLAATQSAHSARCQSSRRRT